MHTEFLKSLHRPDPIRCYCSTTTTINQLDDDGLSYQIVVCAHCSKPQGNKIYHFDQQEVHDDIDNEEFISDDLYLDEPSIHRTPKKYRARYRRIVSDTYITNRSSGLEISGNPGFRMRKLINQHASILQTDVTYSLNELIDLLRPTGALYK